MRSALLSRSATHTLIVRDLGTYAVIQLKKLSFDSVVFSAGSARTEIQKFHTEFCSALPEHNKRRAVLYCAGEEQQ
jgi:hypothetical protein